MKTGGKGGAWAVGPLGEAPAGSLLEMRVSWTFLFSCFREQGQTQKMEATYGEGKLDLTEGKDAPAQREGVLCLKGCT